jgi:hypothetical protein
LWEIFGALLAVRVEVVVVDATQDARSHGGAAVAKQSPETE